MEDILIEYTTGVRDLSLIGYSNPLKTGKRVGGHPIVGLMLDDLQPTRRSKASALIEARLS